MKKNPAILKWFVISVLLLYTGTSFGDALPIVLSNQETSSHQQGLLDRGGSEAGTVVRTMTVPSSFDPPAITGPHYGKINTTYSFSLGTLTDPDGDQLFVLWDWGDDETSGWLGPYYSGGIVNASHAWSTPGEYSIRVKLRDIYGAESNWSAPFPLTIVQLKNAFFLGIFEHINYTEDLILLDVGPFVVLPSSQTFYSSRIIVIDRECLGFFGTILAVGVGGVATP